MSRKFIVFVITLCTFAGFFSFIYDSSTKGEEKVRNFSCQGFQSSCEVILGSQLYNVSFDSQILYTEQTVTMLIESGAPNNALTSENVVWDESTLSITGVAEGITMYMGKVPLIFKQVPNKKEPLKHVYQTTLAFGSCSEKEMVWRIWLGQSNQQSLITLDEKKLNNKGFLDITVIRR